MTSLRTGTWVTDVEGRPPSLSVRKVRLEVIEGPDKGRTVELESTRARIGARKRTDLALTDQRVSGVHCELSIAEDGYRVRDLGSKNGTFVDGVRIVEAFLAPDAVITVGGTRIRFAPLPDSVERALYPSAVFAGMIGQSAVMRELFARIERIATTDVTVLVTGETGTGKELVAEAIHERSRRAKGPLVVLDCSAIPENLVESELFGHERGAFTGATGTAKGAFERAHGGTLFLDELGELPLATQPKLLRALEKREIRRVGGEETIAVDLRVVAATHRDLELEVTRGHFREDLYYRIAVAPIELPALRERREDVPLLVEHFLGLIEGAQKLTPEAMRAFGEHGWPGNVRELRNAVERAVLFADLPAARKRAPESAEVDVSVPFKAAKQRLIDEFEQRYLTALLAKHGGNITAAARAAGIDRMSIHKILARHR